MNSSWSTKDKPFNKVDAYYLDFKANQKVNFIVNEITGGSVAQVALYSGKIDSLSLKAETINLFTKSNGDLFCNTGEGSCNNFSTGESELDFSIPTTGTYTFAITRNYGQSCGSDGTYKMKVKSNSKFVFDQKEKVQFFYNERERHCD